MFTQVLEHRPVSSANQDLAEWCSDGLYSVLFGLKATCVIQAENYFTEVTMLALLGKIHREEHIFISQRKKIRRNHKNSNAKYDPGY